MIANGGSRLHRMLESRRPGESFGQLATVSRIAVIALSIVSSYFALHTLSFIWSPAGIFGIFIVPETAIVADLAPRNEAKGLRLGDRVDLARMPFRDRAFLYQNMFLPVGLRLAIPVVRGHSIRTVIVETIPYQFGLDFAVSAFGRKILAIVYILTAIVLVWSRPSVMMWGLAVFLIQQHPNYIAHSDSPAIAATQLFFWYFIFALGLPGLIVFAARFPDGRSDKTTKYWDALAFAVFVFYMYTSLQPYAPLFTTRPVAILPEWVTTGVSSIAFVLIFIALCIQLVRKRKRRASPGFRWILAGYGVGTVIGWTVFNDILDYLIWSDWIAFAQQIVMLALPASVAYAVIRHRAFGLGYLANRTLVYGGFSIAAASTVFIGVWAASGQLTSTLGIATAMFAASIVGMTFRTSRTFVVRLVDRLFLRRRYEAAVSLDRIRDALHGASDPKRLIDDVAATLGLASLAMFSRTPDGGFVRSAAVGWPPGSAWHLLPAESLTRAFDDGDSIVPVPSDADDEITLPPADARPRFAVMLRRADRVERAILVGPQRSGADLDRDAMRSLHGVFADAVAV